MTEARPTPTPSSPPQHGRPMETHEAVDVKTWGIFAHISSLTYVLGGVLAFLGPLVVWLIGRDKSAMIDQHGKQALNFGITVSLFALAIWIITMVATFTLGLIGIVVNLLWVALFVFWVIFMIIATVKAGQGEVYHYPVSFRMVK